MMSPLTGRLHAELNYLDTTTPQGRADAAENRIMAARCAGACNRGDRGRAGTHWHGDSAGSSAQHVGRSRRRVALARLIAH